MGRLRYVEVQGYQATVRVLITTKVFSTLVPPHPNAPTPPPSSAYLYLAQLSVDDPWEALRLYEAAIDVLHSQLKGKDRAVAPIDAKSDEEDERNIKNGIVRALVGMVEIWMDPAYELWYVDCSKTFLRALIANCLRTFSDLPQAEQTCEDLLQKAQKVDPGNTEALQALASVRMSQSRADDAKACLEQAWSTWKHLELGKCFFRLFFLRLFMLTSY
jgi:tetratricopeptide (TPR) repeat protein